MRLDQPVRQALVPTDRPTLVLAEGLFMYLPDAQVHHLIDRVITHLPQAASRSMASPGG